MSNSKRIFPRDKGPSIWRRIKWKLDAFWTAFTNIPDNLRMIAEWVPVLWNNWDWDYNYLLDIMEYKLNRMSKHIGKHNRHTTAQKHAQQIRICCDLIKRLRENDYTKIEEHQHEEKWGDLICDSIPVPDDDPLTEKYGKLYTMDMFRVKARGQGLEDQEREETRELHDLALKRRNRDLDALFNIMRRRIERWWD